MKLLAVAALAASLLIVPTAAQASATHPLKLRKGLTLNLPDSWKVYGKGDWIHVVTGKCAKPKGGYFEPDCKGFWVFGPKALKTADEGFDPYDPDNGGYYPASDVQRCPVDGRLSRGGSGGKTIKGFRQIGPGHRAIYRESPNVCLTADTYKRTKVRFTHREWYLPKSKILIVDEMSTPGLPAVLKNAVWR